MSRSSSAAVLRPAGATVEVTVTVPATSANLGPGFDAFGLALGLRDTVTVRLADEGLDVRVEGEGAGTLPCDDRHLIVRAARAAFARLGYRPAGLAVHCRNVIPQGRGLGSSAAAIVAGVVAARALAAAADPPVSGLSAASSDAPLGEAVLKEAMLSEAMPTEAILSGAVPAGAMPADEAPPGAMPTEAVLQLGAELEGHPDNVAACLLGGLTLAWTEYGRVRAVRLPVAGLPVTALVPPFEASTAAVRGLLPATVPHKDAAHNLARSALLVEALARRPELLLAATVDRLHQPYRAAAMPATAELVRILRDRGLPAVVSGAGPTVLVLGPGPLDVPAGWTALSLGVDLEGAAVTMSGPGPGHAAQE